MSSAELFNPANETFTATTGSMTSVREFATATLLPDGEVLIAGGYDGNGFVSSAEVFDPANGTFTVTTGSMSSARAEATATVLPDGKVLIAGGYDGSGFSSSAELFDPATLAFTPLTASMTSARELATATLLPDGQVLIAGGFNNSGALSSAELFDPATGTFTATPGSMTTARDHATATLLPDGQVLLAGGTDGGGVVSSAELFDPATGTFTATGAMTTGREEATATLLPDGQVLIAGGEGSGGALSSAEVFDATARLVVTAPASAISGSAASASVSAIDAGGEPTTTYAGTVTLTSTDAGATLGAGTTAVAGVAHPSVTFATAGTQTLTATDSVFSGVLGATTVTVTAASAGTGGTTPPASARLAGADRFGTAIAASQSKFPIAGSAGAVIVTRSDGFADALVAAPLAAAKNAPMLFADGGSLTAATQAEVIRVLPAGGTAYILGGPNAVPASVATTLSGLGFTTVRVSGDDRYATALAVAHTLGDPGTVLLATGTKFPDALAAGPAAAHLHGVALLTDGARLPAAVHDYLAAHPGTVYGVGGSAAAADPAATPVVGADRYATAALLDTTVFNSPTTVGFASGAGFADALSGGVFEALAGGPLLLSTPIALPTPVGGYLAANNNTIAAATTFGGTAALATTVQNEIAVALGW